MKRYRLSLFSTLRSDIYYALENAIEAIVARSGTERERALQAVCEIKLLKKSDLTEHVEAAYFEEVKRFKKELEAGKISDEDLRRLRANLWELYKSVAKSLHSSD